MKKKQTMESEMKRRITKVDGGAMEIGIDRWTDGEVRSKFE